MKRTISHFALLLGALTPLIPGALQAQTVKISPRYTTNLLPFVESDISYLPIIDTNNPQVRTHQLRYRMAVQLMANVFSMITNCM
jgi:cytochrome c biogenesis factor